MVEWIYIGYVGLDLFVDCFFGYDELGILKVTRENLCVVTRPTRVSEK